MFYSTEILTSRKYGIATVWLVATLGAKSNLRKINRKAITDVDVPKACQTISQPPDGPLSLRLSSSLLYGVSRVYVQQCSYVLTDAQNTHNALRVFFKVQKNAALDPEAGRARPEQLILEDDPAFLPEFAFPPLELVFDNLDDPTFMATQYTGESLSLTPFGSGFSSQHTPHGPVGGLILPSSSSRDMGGFTIQGDNGPGTIRDYSGMLGDEEEVPLNLEPEFSFDDEGNIVEFNTHQEAASTPVVAGGQTVGSDAGASAQVRRDHEEGQRVGAQLTADAMDLDFPITADILPQGEASLITARDEAGDHLQAMNEELVESTSDFAAPLRGRPRGRRVLPSDETTELSHRVISDWGKNYLDNMAEASKVKAQHKIITQAKKNADYCIWQSGIGNVGGRFASTTAESPLDMFHGNQLFELITGVSRSRVAGKKHDRDSGIDEATQDEARNVRHRSDEHEQQRGSDLDEGMFAPMDDQEVEFPREAPSAMNDSQIFSAMPWNSAASLRGSSAIPRSGRLGTGAASSLPGAPGSLGRRGSRVVSASPLHGRGQAGGLEALQSYEGEDEFGIISGEDFGFPQGPPGTDSDALYGEAAPFPAVESQPSAQVREAISAEGENFLDFVSDKLEEKRQRLRTGLDPETDILQAEVVVDVNEVLFEEILPPSENNKMVAAQGLMMVLALGSRGLLTVRQDEQFGDIGLAFTHQGTERKPHGTEQEDPEEGVDVGPEVEEESNHDDLYED